MPYHNLDFIHDFVGGDDITNAISQYLLYVRFSLAVMTTHKAYHNLPFIFDFLLVVMTSHMPDHNVYAIFDSCWR